MTAWLERKSCRPEHADLFFGDERAMAAALALCRSCPVVALCRGCPVAAQCAEYAMRERQDVRRRRRGAA